ncbi:hypothetical protein VKT23_010548 [Stygiomarasmius scandens]|uniref:Uncharacterized protein n=1 Tax=Marasmiellus scandens TaxID=2682957 RepID=A0ABR1JHR9_9AGAR
MVNHELPPELVEKIIFFAWHSILPSFERILFMITCPLLNHTWNAQFSRIASRQIYIPKLSYLLYLANIVRTGKSLVYSQHDLRERAETMTCFLDLRSYPNMTRSDRNTEEMYWIFNDMGNYSGLRSCFPSLEELSLEAALYTPPNLWTSETPQIAHTQVVVIFDKEERERKEKEDLPGRRSRHTIELNLTIHDPDAYLGVTNALWKYRSSPLAVYLTLLIRVVMGDLIKSLQFRSSQDPMGNQYQRNMSKILRLSKRLQKSRKLKGMMHLFGTSATLVESAPMNLFGVNRRLWRCGKENVFDWNSMYTRLCELTVKMWPASVGLGSGMNVTREGEWDLILPVDGIQQGANASKRFGMANESGLDFFFCLGLELPFSAVQDLHEFIQANASKFSKFK